MTVSPLATALGFPHMRANSVLVREQGSVVVVDCGGQCDEPSIRAGLGALGISASDVELLVLTHLHYDHCENVDLFERASVAVHWRELEWLQRLLGAETEEALSSCVSGAYEAIHPYYLRTLCRRLMTQRRGYLRILKDRSRLTVIDGDTALLGGLVVVETPGHSAGHLAVRVSGRRPVWIAGDAVISREHHLRGDIAQHVCWDKRRCRESAAAVCAANEPIVPGHGTPFDPCSGNELAFEALC